MWGPSALLGAATGLLWAPCTGPILGLVLTGAAISGPNAHTTALLFAYAAGASTSLGWDGTVLTRLSLAGTNRLEQSLLDRAGSRDANGAAESSMAMRGAMTGGQPMMMTSSHSADPAVEGEMPSLGGATSWFNSPPLTPELLRGKATLAQAGELSIENFSAAGASLGTVRVAKIIKSDAEWRAQLSPLAFRVARQEGTEAAFSGEYAGNHTDGIYRCICCDTALFDSRTKFESGTGWPSFWQPISPKNVAKRSDSSFGMQRDAISCRRCDAHLGHVFDDGPRPTGLRYCMNSVTLRLVPRS